MSASLAPSAVAYMAGDLLVGADAAVAGWVARKIPGMDGHGFGPCTAIGVVRDGKLVAGVVYHDFLGFAVQMSVAATDRRWLNRGKLRALFDYPFNYLGVTRAWSIIHVDNARARKFIEGLGFQLEGIARHGLRNGDGAVYSLLRHECRWLAEK